jgi:hypothetical protein
MEYCGATKRGRLPSERALAVAALFGALAATSSLAAREPVYLEVDEAACARMVEHVPDADVTYQPGVDVHGNAVAPADLNPVQVVPPNVFWIPLDIDLADRFGIPPDPKLFEGKIIIGTVRVEGNRVTYDGQELTDPQEQALAELCQRR